MEETNPRKRTVLVVDDDENSRESLQRIVERSGYEFLQAANGVEGLAVLRSNDVQVVVADHDMPGMDGIEMLRLIGLRHPHVCRILLTASTDPTIGARALNIGNAYRLLQKPYRAGDLVTTLHFAFVHAETELENQRLGHKLRTLEALLAEVRRRHPGLVEEIEAGPARSMGS